MDQIRTPYQGLWNVIRFNWHFYLLSCFSIPLLLSLSYYLPELYRVCIGVLCLLVMFSTMLSLIVTYYVYDLSELYRLTWLDGITIASQTIIINIHAGFDETSILIKAKYPDSDLKVFDFYDPAKHTEISIKRARKSVPPYINTMQVPTSHIPVVDNEADLIFVILSAHEIRDQNERNVFFAELKRIINPTGKIIVTEHLRDLPNFIAYNIGSFHFIPKSAWLTTFEDNQLYISREIRITPFITTFILEKHGTST